MSDESTFHLHPDPPEAHAAAARLFERISVRLREVLPAGAEIRHVGATAIPGCLTKGDLDIVVRVPADMFAAVEQQLAGLYRRNGGSIKTDTFAAFEDPSSEPHLGIQLTAIGGPFDEFHSFADILRASPKLVAAYNALKRRFNGSPMDEYRAAKDELIAKVLSDALDRR